MLDINGVAVLTQAIAFVLLVIFLKKVAVGPIGSVIESRQKEIHDTLEQVAADRRATEQSRVEYEKRLADIEAQAREHIATAIKQANEEGAALLAKARAEAEEVRARSLAEIEQERKRAITEIRAEMADLAVAAAGKIIQREINPAVHRDLIKNLISQVGAGSKSPPGW